MDDFVCVAIDGSNKQYKIVVLPHKLIDEVVCGESQVKGYLKRGYVVLECRTTKSSLHCMAAEKLSGIFCYLNVRIFVIQVTS